MKQISAQALVGSIENEMKKKSATIFSNLADQNLNNSIPANHKMIYSHISSRLKLWNPESNTQNPPNVPNAQNAQNTNAPSPSK